MKQIEEVVAQLAASKAGISRERDKLRDLLDEAKQILISTEDADQGLETAIDSLSQYL